MRTKFSSIGVVVVVVVDKYCLKIFHSLVKLLSLSSHLNKSVENKTKNLVKLQFLYYFLSFGFTFCTSKIESVQLQEVVVVVVLVVVVLVVVVANYSQW